MTPRYKCQDCANQDVRYVLNGHHYTPEKTCDYNMTTYPRAKECRKFTPSEHDNGEEE